MRVTSELWVRSYLRRCSAAGIPAAVVRHGDDDAGAIFLKVNRLDGSAQLFTPAPAGFAAVAEDRRFLPHDLGAIAPESEIDAYLGRQIAFDSDLWVLEIEDRRGRHLLDEQIMPRDAPDGA